MKAKVRPTARRTTPRAVKCAPCEGSGVELGLVGDEIVSRPCFWCDGDGFVIHHPGDEGPAVCPACHRPGVVIDGQAVCPDCTHYTLATDAAELPDAA